MLRSPALCGSVLSLSLALAWSATAFAQTDATPPPAPPAEPPPAPAPPPAAPAPSPEPTPPAAPPTEPPPAAPPPAAPAPAPPPSGAFPLPPPTTPPATKPAPEPKPSVEPKPAARPAPTPSPSKPVEALPRDEPTAPADTTTQDAAVPPPAAPEPAEVAHHEDEGESVDQFKIGPVAGVGIPSIISFGGTLKLTRFLGAGVNIGLIPKVQLDYYGKATLSYQHYDIYGRLYPFGGGFFLGAGAGYATVDGTLASSYSSPPTMLAGQSIPGLTATYSGEGSVRTLMLTALIGYFYTTSIGFSIGVDAGAQIPIAPSQISFKSELKPPELGAVPAVSDYKKSADDSVRSSLEKIGRTPLPTLNLRIGWIL